MATTESLPLLGSTCDACGAEVPRADRGRPRRFCDSTCRSAYRRLRRAALCATVAPECDHPLCSRPAELVYPGAGGGSDWYACSGVHARMVTLVHATRVVEAVDEDIAVYAGRLREPLTGSWVSWSAPEPQDVRGRYTRGAGAAYWRYEFDAD